MLTLTFEEYDLLAEEAESEEVNDDFEYPCLSEIPILLTGDTGLYKVLLAYYNTGDKEYRKSIQQHLCSEIYLVNSEDMINEDKIISQLDRKKKLKMTIEKNAAVLNCVKNMDFQLVGYFPAKTDLDSYLQENTEENIAFLYWIINSSMDDLTEQELAVKAYAMKLIEQKVKILEESK